MLVRTNVIVYACCVNPQLGVQDWRGGVITNNLFINVTEPSVLNTYAIAFGGSVHEVSVSNNAVYNLHSSDALLLFDTDKVRYDV